MKKSRPLIGITIGYDYEKDFARVRSGYYNAVNKAGGLAMLIPVTTDDDVLADLVDRCDGFLISGGPDLDPVHFGEAVMNYNGEICPGRDNTELSIIRKAAGLNKPFLGICRGIQVINVALGGTLYQDIYSQITGRELYQHSQKAPKWYPTHEINIERNTEVWASFKKDTVRVNSFHHQALKDIAPGFQVTSRSSDGIVESIENPDLKFAVGVQWHPEEMWRENSEHLGIFKVFLKHCSGKRIY